MELQWYHRSLLSPTKWRERGTSGIALPLQRVGKEHASLTDSWGSRHLSWQDAAPKVEMSHPQTLGIRGTRVSESWDHLDSWQPLVRSVEGNTQVSRSSLQLFPASLMLQQKTGRLYWGQWKRRTLSSGKYCPLKARDTWNSTENSGQPPEPSPLTSSRTLPSGTHLPCELTTWEKKTYTSWKLKSHNSMAYQSFLKFLISFSCLALRLQFQPKTIRHLRNASRKTEVQSNQNKIGTQRWQRQWRINL